jgi:exopolyphosphatase/guanosine-5'-triphosphate,3'-diphosphate pyrophosphatase
VGQYNSFKSGIGESMKFAVIDLGSYTAKITIAELDNNSLIYILRDEASTNLAENLRTTGKLSDTSMTNTVRKLKEWMVLLTQNKVDRARVFGTAAIRQAANGLEFASRVKMETGLSLELFDDETEAKTLYYGVVSQLDQSEKYSVLNVGGKNCRLVSGSGLSIRKIFVFPLGTVGLREEFMHSDPLSESDYRCLQQHVEVVVASGLKDVELKGATLVQTGGELDYIIQSGCPHQRSKYSAIHPIVVRLSDFEIFSDRIRRMSREQLRNMRPSNQTWMDGAIASNAIVLAIAKELEVEYMVPSNLNVADGVLMEMKREAKLIIS